MNTQNESKAQKRARLAKSIVADAQKARTTSVTATTEATTEATTAGGAAGAITLDALKAASVAAKQDKKTNGKKDSGAVAQTKDDKQSKAKTEKAESVEKTELIANSLCRVNANFACGNG